MTRPESLEARVRRLEDRIAIRELIARYGFSIDDRDMNAIGDCFCRDGRFRSRDGVLDASGREAILEQFRGRFAVLGPSNHFTHDCIIEFGCDEHDKATGLVNSHAEVVRHGVPMLTALRYSDCYRRDGDGRWRFSDRLLSFFYYLDIADYPRLLADSQRMRAYAEPAPADIPEGLTSWRAYYGED